MISCSQPCKHDFYIWPALTYHIFSTLQWHKMCRLFTFEVRCVAPHSTNLSDVLRMKADKRFKGRKEVLTIKAVLYAWAVNVREPAVSGCDRRFLYFNFICHVTCQAGAKNSNERCSPAAGDSDESLSLRFSSRRRSFLRKLLTRRICSRVQELIFGSFCDLKVTQRAFCDFWGAGYVCERLENGSLCMWAEVCSWYWCIWRDIPPAGDTVAFQISLHCALRPTRFIFNAFWVVRCAFSHAFLRWWMAGVSWAAAASYHMQSESTL